MTNIPNNTQNRQEGIHDVSEQSAITSGKNLDNNMELHEETMSEVQENSAKQQKKKSNETKEKTREKKLEEDRVLWNTDTNNVIPLIDELLENPEISELFDNPTLIKDKLSQKDLHEKLLYVVELNLKDKNKSLEILNKFLGLRESCKKLCEQWKRLWPEDWNIMEMNQKHAVILLDSLNIICEEQDSKSGKIDLKFVSKKGFTDFYENKCFIDSKDKPRNKAKHWLAHPDRREYRKIVFKPGEDRSSLEKYGEYNTFRGYAVSPRPGDCSLFKEHIENNICCGNKKLFEYVWKWMASVVQHIPPSTNRTAIILMGEQGTGKSLFADIFGSLLGQHYIGRCSLKQLTSNFNAQFESALLIHSAEALWGGNKQYVGDIKALITDLTLTIERKGKDCYEVDNYIHVIFSSNEDWPAPLDNDDRRFLVLKVSSAQKNNQEYFGKILDQMRRKEGLEAMLHELLQVDLKGFDVSKIPSTQEKFDLKMRNQDSIAHYVHQGVLIENRLELQVQKETIWTNKDVYGDYKTWCDENEHKPLSSNIFGRKLREIIPSIPKNKKIAAERPGESRPKAYVFPPLPQCKKEFRTYFKIDDSLDVFEE